MNLTNQLLLCITVIYSFACGYLLSQPHQRLTEQELRIEKQELKIEKLNQRVNRIEILEVFH
jgi:hypothetical protein